MSCAQSASSTVQLYVTSQGTSTGGSSTTCVDSTQSWTTNQWIGYTFYCYATGPGSGFETATITANTATTLTFGTIGTAITSGKVYGISSNGAALSYSNSALSYGPFTTTGAYAQTIYGTKPQQYSVNLDTFEGSCTNFQWINSPSCWGMMRGDGQSYNDTTVVSPAGYPSVCRGWSNAQPTTAATGYAASVGMGVQLSAMTKAKVHWSCQRPSIAGGSRWDSLIDVYWWTVADPSTLGSAFPPRIDMQIIPALMDYGGYYGQSGYSLNYSVKTISGVTYHVLVTQKNPTGGDWGSGECDSNGYVVTFFQTPTTIPNNGTPGSSLFGAASATHDIYAMAQWLSSANPQDDSGAAIKNTKGTVVSSANGNLPFNSSLYLGAINAGTEFEWDTVQWDPFVTNNFWVAMQNEADGPADSGSSGGGTVTPPTVTPSWTFDSTAMTFDNTRYFMDGYYGGSSPTPPVLPIPTIEARGCWVLPGGAQAIWVMGAGCFLMTVATAPGANTAATFNIQRVGTLLTSTGQVGIRDNGAGGVVCIVDGPNGYFYVFGAAGSAVGGIGTFKKITDPDFLGADKVVFIDGWWVFNQPGTQNFYTPTATYSTVFNASNFALNDAATDLLVSIHENKEELWLFGERHTEIWYDSGGTYFAFQRLVSTMIQIGCSAKHSVARLNTEGEDGLIWLGRSERGQNVVVRTQGYATEVVSTPAINSALAKYQKIDDAIGYTYQADGHEFYVLTFPTADVTWVYDASTNFWHQRLAYDPYLNLWHRHRSNCFCNFQNQRLVGDYQNGLIYALRRDVYTDGAYPLVAWRRAPHIWDGGARERVFLSSLQIEFKPGQGLQTGTVTPEAFLTLSRDGGATFGSAVAAPLGSVGQYRTRTIWRRLGNARDAVFDVKVYDPVNRDIVGATLRRASAVELS